MDATQFNQESNIEKNTNHLRTKEKDISQESPGPGTTVPGSPEEWAGQKASHCAGILPAGGSGCPVELVLLSSEHLLDGSYNQKSSAGASVWWTLHEERLGKSV